MATRCAIYVRISNDPRGEGLGVARQEAECRALAEARGWEIVSVHTDNDVSASKKSIRRPGYDQLLTEIRESRIDAVVAWAHHRLHRRIVELGTFLEDYVQPHQLQVAFVGGDIDLSTPAGRTLAKILGAVAEGEIDELRWRVMSKQRELAAAGKVGNGGRRPYGYDKTRTEIVPAEAAIIREVAARVLAGDSLHGMVRDLNARGISSAMGGTWSRQTLRAAVIKPHVAAVRIYQGQVVGEGTWPAILDRGTWEAVRGILKAPSRTRPGSNTRRWLLSGIARCGPCGAGLSVGYVNGYSLYRCVSATCTQKVYRAQHRLDAYVIGAALQLLDHPAVRIHAAEQETSPTMEIVELQTRRDQVVLDAATNPRITLVDRDRSLDAIDGRLLDLQVKLSAAAANQVLAASAPMTPEEFDALPLDRRRALVASLLTILVWPTKRRGGGVFETETIDLEPAKHG